MDNKLLLPVIDRVGAWVSMWVMASKNHHEVDYNVREATLKIVDLDKRKPQTETDIP